MTLHRSHAAATWRKADPDDCGNGRYDYCTLMTTDTSAADHCTDVVAGRKVAVVGVQHVDAPGWEGDFACTYHLAKLKLVP